MLSGLVKIWAATLAAAAISPSIAHSSERLNEPAFTDAYVYLLGRALVDRQEKIDIGEAGVGYNQIKYNPVGAAEFVNPNLDVAYLEAWIAVDDQSAVLLEVPLVEERYYTVQICD